MRVLDLFSGIGGFSLAGHWAGMTTAAFCEIEPFCQKVLNKNFPGVPVYEDVRTITRQQLEKDGVMSDSDPIGLICGGIPCQPFSVSGKQLGTEDERHLWPEMYRLVKEIRPTWVLVENVTGFIKLALDLIINDLENEDYQTGTFVIPAAAVGAPHKRERIFIVGHSKRSGCSREPWRRTREVTKNRHLQLEKENVADTNSPGQQEFNVATIAKREGFYTRGVDQIESEGVNQSRLGRVLDGLPDWMDGYRLTRWPAYYGELQHEWEPLRVAPDVKNRKERLRALGNTVVPQVVYPILKAIMETE